MTPAFQLMQELGARAHLACQSLATAPSQTKNAALCEAARQIRAHQAEIQTANNLDIKAAKTKGLSDALIDRLLLNPARIEAMALGLENIAAQPDPVGVIVKEWVQPPHGLHISRISVPLGVIGVIYESRPNVTADAGGLCLKSGNAVILRGGSDSLHSSQAIVKCLREGLSAAQLPVDAIQLVTTPDRAAVDAMLTMVGVIDVVIPRGGPSLNARVAETSRVPTLLHLDGNCHTYLHKDANPETALAVVLNAKLRRTGICGATESLLADAAIIHTLLPTILRALLDAGCAVRGDEICCALDPRIEAATEEDWRTEYLNQTLSVKIVHDVDDAIRHINHYGSHHTDAIITEDKAAASRFTAQIDSAIVMVNTSTQFADGGEFGMGAEIGIATGKLHARGPVGCAELTTYKYVINSTGALRP